MIDDTSALTSGTRADERPEPTTSTATSAPPVYPGFESPAPRDPGAWSHPGESDLSTSRSTESTGREASRLSVTLSNGIRQAPLTAVAAALGLGFLLGRAGR